jgi:hypothetical protein
MKDLQRAKNADRRRGESRLSRVATFVVLFGMIGGILLLSWNRCSQPARSSDYEGTIVERWADYAEGSQGSEPRLRLVVESQDGKRITVKVDPNVYETARVGMTIKNHSGQIVLIHHDSSANK